MYDAPLRLDPCCVYNRGEPPSINYDSYPLPSHSQIPQDSGAITLHFQPKLQLPAMLHIVMNTIPPLCESDLDSLHRGLWVLMSSELKSYNPCSRTLRALELVLRHATNMRAERYKLLAKAKQKLRKLLNRQEEVDTTKSDASDAVVPMEMDESDVESSATDVATDISDDADDTGSDTDVATDYDSLPDDEAPDS